MTRHGTPPKIPTELAVAIAESDTESLEAELATLRAAEPALSRRVNAARRNGPDSPAVNRLAEQLNAARRSARAIEIELRRRDGR